MVRQVIWIAAVSSLVILVAPTHGGDWSRFRGTNGSGISADGKETPTKWSSSENVKWKVAMPGPGSSSPIVVGDRVFVTCWSGYGLDQQDPGDQSQLRRHLVCIDRNSGATIWSKVVEPFLPEDAYQGMFTQHGYASHTPVSDGEHVYAFFGKTGAMAFDMKGNELWQTSVGTESGPRGWGSASSPILHKNLVIVTASAESDALVALDKSTGKEVWRQEAAGFDSVWGTPVLVPVDGEGTDLVIAVPNEIWGLNPDTGKLRWYCDGVPASSFCSSAVFDDGVVYAMESGPGGGGGIAVRVGGKGDVTESHVVWAGNQSNRIGTPVVLEGRLFVAANKIVTCFDATTGKEKFKSRLASPSRGNAPPPEQTAQPERRGGGEAGRGGGSRGGPGGRGGRFGGGRGGGFGGQDYASPVLADGKLYVTSRGGEIFVLAVGDRFEQLAVNRLTEDSEDFSATPAISNGELFVRSDKHLYCVASP